MREKRRRKRFEVVSLSGQLRGATEVRVTDISLTGMAVETGVNLRVGASYSILVRDDHGEAGQLCGQVMWSFLHDFQTTEDGDVLPIFRAGVQFDEALSGDERNIVSVIQRNARLHLERWVEGKFTVRSYQGISVYLDYVFRVEMLSRRGMVVEVDLAPEVGSEFEMELRLDDGTCTFRGQITEVKRVKKIAGESTSLLRVVFTELSDEDWSVLDQFITSEIDTSLGVDEG